MNVSKDFEELFAFFNARNVKLLIVGGYAVAFHAKPRFTEDIDLWVEPTPRTRSASSQPCPTSASDRCP